MPDLDDQGAMLEHGPTDGSPLSRRSVMRGAAGAGAAGLAATALGSRVIPARASTTGPRARTSPDEVTTTDPMVLHVRDAAAGEIEVFRGTTQIRLHDRDLAARIVRASRKAR